MNGTDRIQNALRNFHENVRRYRIEYQRTINAVLHRIDERKIQKARQKLLNDLKK